MMSSLFPRCESAPLLEQELPDFAEHRREPCSRRAKRPCKNQPHRFSVDAKASGDSWISNVNCIAILLRKTVLHVPERMTWRKPVFRAAIMRVCPGAHSAPSAGTNGSNACRELAETRAAIFTNCPAARFPERRNLRRFGCRTAWTG